MILRTKTFLISVLVLVSFCACVEQSSKKANAILTVAQEDYEQGNLTRAQLLIDSLHSTYPQEVSIRRKADTLSWHIGMVESYRNYIYADSMLVIKRAELEPLLKNFRFEKDSIYQDLGQYVPTKLRTEINTERCYLKPYVDEQGAFYVMSYYVGNPINYNRIKASVGDVFTESSAADASDCHSYSDLNLNHETVLFRPSTLGYLGQFIADHSEERVRITLIGKSEYSYYLNELERQLFYETYSLSISLSDIYELDQQYKKNVARYNRLKQRLERNN